MWQKWTTTIQNKNFKKIKNRWDIIKLLYKRKIFCVALPLAWRRKWQPTPVFLPGESLGWRSLVGCRLWGRTESDTTEATAAAATWPNIVVTHFYHLLKRDKRRKIEILYSVVGPWVDPWVGKEMATFSPGGGNGNPLQYLAWRIPWTEDPGGLQSLGHKESDATEWLHFLSLKWWFRALKMNFRAIQWRKVSAESVYSWTKSLSFNFIQYQVCSSQWKSLNSDCLSVKWGQYYYHTGWLLGMKRKWKERVLNQTLQNKNT